MVKYALHASVMSTFLLQVFLLHSVYISIKGILQHGIPQVPVDFVRSA
jgi:hypothetical protein